MKSFLPLEKKPFFFLACAEQSVCAGLSAGMGAGGERRQTSAAVGDVSDGSDVGLVEGRGWGRRSVCSVGSGRGEGGGCSVWGCGIEGPGSCGSVEDVQVPFRKKR